MQTIKTVMSNYRQNAVDLYEAAARLGLVGPAPATRGLWLRGRHNQGCGLGALLARHTTYARGLAMRVLDVEPENEAAGFMTVYVGLNRMPHQAALAEKVRGHSLLPVEVLSLMAQAWGEPGHGAE